MPSKRVSLKGKGADLFFGGEQAAVSETNEREVELSPPPPPAQDTPEASSTAPEQPAPEVAPRAARPQRTRSRQTRSNGAEGTSRDMSPSTDPTAAQQAREQESNHASTLASFDGETIDTIRKVVKVVGRDVSFVRLSAEEKRRLGGIVYTYKMQGIKTSENELYRIAINLLLEDYESNGEQSVLARVLAALQA